MRKVSLLLFMAVTVALISCNNSKEASISEQYHLDKKFWDQHDYSNAVNKIKYGGEANKPAFDNELAPVLNKMLDMNNISVVMEDESLGIEHRSDFGNAIFDEWRDLREAYHGKDEQDMFKYPTELVEILKFGLGFQQYYFKLGNDKVRIEEDDVDKQEVKRVVRHNLGAMVSNYNLYLDYMDYEESFTDPALNSYAEGIDRYFPQLMEKFPNASYNSMQKKAAAMLKKTEHAEVKQSLEILIQQIKDHKQMKKEQKQQAETEQQA